MLFTLIIAYIYIILYLCTSAARTKNASEAADAPETIAQAMRRNGRKGNKRQLNRQAEEAYKAACVAATTWLKVSVYKSLHFLNFPDI
jgi:hypothetical protein